jgi:hypothetical protein
LARADFSPNGSGQVFLVSCWKFQVGSFSGFGLIERPARQGREKLALGEFFSRLPLNFPHSDLYLLDRPAF